MTKSTFQGRLGGERERERERERGRELLGVADAFGDGSETSGRREGRGEREVLP